MIGLDGKKKTLKAAEKGKAKVSGTLANGTKVSAKGQLIVGEEWCCVPVVVSKKAKFAFAVWLPKAATSAALPVVVGLVEDVKVGKRRRGGDGGVSGNGRGRPYTRGGAGAEARWGFAGTGARHPEWERHPEWGPLPRSRHARPGHEIGGVFTSREPSGDVSCNRRRYT